MKCRFTFYLLIFAIFSGFCTCIGANASDFSYGNLESNLASRVSIRKHSFESTNEPIEIRVGIRNTSTNVVHVWDCGFWCNHRVIVRDEKGNEVVSTTIGKAAIDEFSPRAPRASNILVPLQSGAQQDLRTLNLREFFEINRRGIYSVQVLYEEYHKSTRNRSVWEGKCWSNIVLFEIK